MYLLLKFGCPTIPPYALGMSQYWVAQILLKSFQFNWDESYDITH